MTKALQIAAALERVYPEALCALRYDGEPWRLMVMARLSAQCTDLRVNQVCEILFDRFPTYEALADAPLEEVEAIVRPCGLYHVKAREIIAECVMLRDEYNGRVPDTMEELLRFPGVGRKVANLLLGDLYKLPAVVVDTHCIRLSGRWGLVPAGEKNPVKIERILTAALADLVGSGQSDFCHRIVLFGREYCSARAPRCVECPIRALCPSADKEAK
ncbi:MAG: endonuclease III [Clostridia bacterium]|nr:endonuclease III [Clostridia bacterium]